MGLAIQSDAGLKFKVLKGSWLENEACSNMFGKLWNFSFELENNIVKVSKVQFCRDIENLSSSIDQLSRAFHIRSTLVSSLESSLHINCWVKLNVSLPAEHVVFQCVFNLTFERLWPVEGSSQFDGNCHSICRLVDIEIKSNFLGVLASLPPTVGLTSISGELCLKFVA